MLNLYVNRPVIEGPWGGGNHWLKAMEYYAHQNNINIVRFTSYQNRLEKRFDSDVDMMFCMSPLESDSDLSLQEMKKYQHACFICDNKHVPIFLRVNECDARKNTQGVDKFWYECSKHVDATVWVSNWLQKYFTNSVGWQCKNNVVIKNGVDKTIFKPNNKLNNGKLNIVCAHWSSDRMKGQDYTEALDSLMCDFSHKFTYTYIGRTKYLLRHSRYIEPLFGKRLGEEIGKYDICVNASRFDPGPNSVIEPISCGLPTYVHKDGGGGVEFAGQDHVFSSFDELKNILFNVDKISNNTTTFQTWEIVMKKFYDYIKDYYYATKASKHT